MLKENNSNQTYLYIIHGNLAQKVDEGTEGAKSRTNKNDKKVWEKHYNSVTGKITGATVKKSDYGDQLNIVINDGECYCIQVPVESSYFRTFVGRLGNIDLTKDVELSPYSFEADGKKKQGFVVRQLGEKIGYYLGDTIEGYPKYPEGLGDSAFKKWLIDKSDFEIKYLADFKFPTFTESVKKQIEGIDFGAEDITADSEAPF